MKLNIAGEGAGKSITSDFQEREVNLPEEGKEQNFNFIVEVINANFGSSGKYKVEILIDNEVIGEVSFKVAESRLTSLGTPS